MSKREYAVFCELVVEAESEEDAKGMIECLLTAELNGFYRITKCIGREQRRQAL